MKAYSKKEGTNHRNVAEEKSSLNHLETLFYLCPLPALATELKADSLVAYDLVLTKQGKSEYGWRKEKKQGLFVIYCWQLEIESQ